MHPFLTWKRCHVFLQTRQTESFFSLSHSFMSLYMSNCYKENITMIRVIKPLDSSTRYFLDFVLSVSNESVREGVMTV